MANRWCWPNVIFFLTKFRHLNSDRWYYFSDSIRYTSRRLTQKFPIKMGIKTMVSGPIHITLNAIWEFGRDSCTTLHKRYAKSLTCTVLDVWYIWIITLQWRHNERDGVSYHWRVNCLLNRLFRRWKHQSSVTGFCEGNPSVAGGFPSQRARNAENLSISWRHHDEIIRLMITVVSFLPGAVLIHSIFQLFNWWVYSTQVSGRGIYYWNKNIDNELIEISYGHVVLIFLTLELHLLMC